MTINEKGAALLRLAAEDASSALWPDPLDLAALAKREPRPPLFIDMHGWLPVGYATLLAGHGGSGKSAIALYLMVCIAAGLAFFGNLMQRQRVLFLSCEDRASVTHWRLSRICAHLGIDMACLRGWLEILDLVGHECVLWDRDPRTGTTTTMAHGVLKDFMRVHDTEVLLVDGVTDTFAGNENARSEVKRYINSLVALIPPERGAVLLIGHVAKLNAASVQTSEGYSGSTGWHNACRARWYLHPEVQDGEDGERQERTGNLTLELQKANMGRADKSMTFVWDDDAHLFVGKMDQESSFDRTHRDREEQSSILRALHGCANATQPIIVPAAMTGPNTAHLVLSQRPEFPQSLRSGKPAKARFRRQIETLRQLGAIAEVGYRRANRHHAAKIELTVEGVRQCATFVS